MALNKSKQDNIEQRREVVAQLRNRMLSMREICDELKKRGIVNPVTGKAYDVATIKSDIDALKAQWRESANVAIDEHQSRQFAEIQEVKRLAWKQQNGNLALSAIDKEMKLLGTAKEFNGIMVNFNIKMETIYQIAELAPQQGLKASDLFETMLRKLQHANE